MEAIRFTQKYNQYLEEIRSVVKPEFVPTIDGLKGIDPHDLVHPDTYFQDENHARGYVWSMFIEKVRHRF